MFLIGAIKPIAEKKFKTCFIFFRNCLAQGRVIGSVLNKTSFISLRCRFGGGNKNFIQKKEENIFNVLEFKTEQNICNFIEFVQLSVTIQYYRLEISVLIWGYLYVFLVLSVYSRKISVLETALLIILQLESQKQKIYIFIL